MKRYTVVSCRLFCVFLLFLFLSGCAGLRISPDTNQNITVEKTETEEQNKQGVFERIIDGLTLGFAVGDLLL